MGIIGCCACLRCSGPRNAPQLHVVSNPDPAQVCWICFQCLSHCACEVCPGCRQARAIDCSGCGSCRECCVCIEKDEGKWREQIKTRHRGVTFHPAVSFDVNPGKRFLALEIEVCGLRGQPGGLTGDRAQVAIAQVMANWGGAKGTDGSLPPGGFELRTAPANGDAFVMQVQEICQALKQYGGWVNDRAGLHCHIDCRDLNYAALRRLTALYVKLEPALFRLVPPGRRDNNYCRPCGERLMQAFVEISVMGGKPTKEWTDANQHEVEAALLDAAIYGIGVDGQQIARDIQAARAARRSVARYKNNHHHGLRYSALNLHSYFWRGTVECRLYPGTVSAEHMLAWATLWGAIVDFAKNDTDGALVKAVRPESPKAGGKILLGLAPTPGVKDWIRASWAQHNPGETLP